MTVAAEWRLLDVAIPGQAQVMDGAAKGPFERAYRGIVRGLYEGRFVPGQRLVAPDLMEQFDVGRNTIREVFSRLAASGIISIVPNRGAHVRTLTRSETRELLEIVELLLGLAARRAAAAAIGSPGHADHLAQAHNALRHEESNDEFMNFVAAREGFYRAMFEMGGSRQLQRLFPNVQVHIMRMQLRRFGRAADAMDFKDFSDIAGAIMAGDADLAERSARNHVRHTTRRVESLPDQAFSHAT